MTAFKDQVSVITGASSGIGRAIALGLAAQGSTLCLVGRRIEALEVVAEAARALAASVCCYCADLSLDEQVRALAVQLAGMDRIDVLIHSAGAIAMGPIESAAAEELDRQYRINVRAPYLLTQALLPTLKRSRGQIVFINSSAGLAARPNTSQFCATQHAFKALADSLRAEVNGDGIRVLSVYPGRTATSRQAAMYAKTGSEYRPELLLQPEDIASVVLNAVSLPRTAEVTDISIRPMQKSY